VGRASVVLGIVVVIVFVLALAWSALRPGPEPAAYPYSQLMADAADGRVSSIVQEGTELTVSLREEAETRVSTVASESVNVYADACAAAGDELGQCSIDYTARAPSTSQGILTLLITALLPVLLIGGFIFFMMRQAQRGPPR
jgi:ATP-dependent Zn protease